MQILAPEIEWGRSCLAKSEHYISQVLPGPSRSAERQLLEFKHQLKISQALVTFFYKNIWLAYLESKSLEYSV